MKLLGATAAPRFAGAEELPGKVNYFIGNDPRKWRANVPTYAGAKYESVYPGVDLVYYGNQRQLEYDFVVAPGADPRSIGIGFEGAEKLSLDDDGNLILTTRDGKVRFQKPVVYQEVDGVRSEVSGRYRHKGARRIGFRVAAYDRSRALIIDPTLIYSTHLGGSRSDSGASIAVDASGSAYVTGDTQSIDFPTTAGAFHTAFNGQSDAFVAKLDSTGSALIYSTYLGGTFLSGSSSDFGGGIAVDASGNAYVAGGTTATDFPTTAGAFDTTLSGVSDGFVTKLNSTGSALIYSTYLGGTNVDSANGMALDASGNAYTTGSTHSTDFPTTAGALQTSNASGGCCDAFLTKLNPAGSALVFSTYLGGSSSEFGYAVAVDVFQNSYVTGETRSTNYPATAGAFQATYGGGDVDGFVTKVDPAGSSLVYSTYLGGSRIDGAFDIAVDASFNAYVAGDTYSPDYPATAGAFDTTLSGVSDCFVTKLNSTGSALVYSTYLGGSWEDGGGGIALDASFNAYVNGYTTSFDFPTTAGAFQTAYVGSYDAFVLKLNPTGSALIYSTFLGGSSDDFTAEIAVDTSFNAYVTGTTLSANFPTTPGAFDTTHNGVYDAFVAKIPDIGTPATLTFSPPAATNPVDMEHCVTAAVNDASGDPSPGIIVRFSVTGSVTFGGSATTDANGKATFCYTGPALPGADSITAFADANNDGTQNPGEPDGAATKTWVPPPTTPLCNIKIANNSSIVTVVGDKATFGGSARSMADGSMQGQQDYQDEGPFQRLKMRSINVQAVVCTGSAAASIFGQATIDGAGSFAYRIDVKDLAKPGKGADTYRIILANGYYSGEQTLQGGNVEIDSQ